MWRKGNPSALLVGVQTGAATMENSMEFPQKTELPNLFLRTSSWGNPFLLTTFNKHIKTIHHTTCNFKN